MAAALPTRGGWVGPVDVDPVRTIERAPASGRRLISLASAVWIGTSALLMTYEVVISLFMFGSGGPVSPQPFVGLADLARMAGGLLVTFGCLVILPLALLASLWIRFRSGAWSRNALRLVGLSPLLLLAWFGVPGLLERYHRQQLTLVQPRAERVAKEFVRSGELLTLHGGLRGSGYFRAAPDGSLRLTLPSHLCSHAYLKWTGQPPKDADLCIWKSGDWSYRCD